MQAVLNGLPQDFRGSINPRARLDQRVVFDRACTLHMTSSMDVPTALDTALVELRHAQICREAGVDISPEIFDRQYRKDRLTCISEFDMIQGARKTQESYEPSI